MDWLLRYPDGLVLMRKGNCFLCDSEAIWKHEPGKGTTYFHCSICGEFWLYQNLMTILETDAACKLKVEILARERNIRGLDRYVISSKTKKSNDGLEVIPLSVFISSFPTSIEERISRTLQNLSQLSDRNNPEQLILLERNSYSLFFISRAQDLLQEISEYSSQGYIAEVSELPNLTRITHAGWRRIEAFSKGSTESVAENETRSILDEPSSRDRADDSQPNSVNIHDIQKTTINAEKVSIGAIGDVYGNSTGEAISENAKTSPESPQKFYRWVIPVLISAAALAVTVILSIRTGGSEIQNDPQYGADSEVVSNEMISSFETDTVGVIEMRLEHNVRPLVPEESGYPLSNMPRGTYGFLSYLDAGSQADYRTIRRIRDNFHFELHKRQDGIIYLVIYVSTETRSTLLNESRDDSIAITAYTASTNSAPQIMAIPLASVRILSNRVAEMYGGIRVASVEMLIESTDSTYCLIHH